MAQKKVVLTTYVDDLSGDELEEANVHTINFGWSGSSYEIDLSASNAGKLEKFIKPYVDAARRVGSTRGRPKGSGGTRASSGSGRSKEELAAVRSWLKQNGHEVNERGRIKGELLDLYDQAHLPAGSPQFTGAE